MKLAGWGGPARRWFALAGLALGYSIAGYTSWAQVAFAAVASIVVGVIGERADRREREKAVVLWGMRADAVETLKQLEDMRRTLQAYGMIDAPYREAPPERLLECVKLVRESGVDSTELIAILKRLAPPPAPAVPDEPSERSE